MITAGRNIQVRHFFDKPYCPDRPKHVDAETAKDPDWWRKDPDWCNERRLKPYATAATVNRSVPRERYRKRMRTFFIGPREDPLLFTQHFVIVGITLMFIYSMRWKGTMSYKRRRELVIRERLYKEYGLTEDDLDEIEGLEAAMSTASNDEDKDTGAADLPRIDLSAKFTTNAGSTARHLGGGSVAERYEDVPRKVFLAKQQ